MLPNIEIKFLTIPEMANARNIDWRYEHVGIDNLGFADKLKNRVYVRAGLESELTKILIDHELNHLFELEGTDEDEHGIRHKKKVGFMKTFLPIALAVVGSLVAPGIGTALGLGGGALATGASAGLGSLLGGVAGSSMTGKPNWIGNTIGGATAGIGAGLGSALGSTAGQATGIGGQIGDIGTTSGSHFLDIAGPTATSASGSGIGKGIGEAIGSGIGTLFTGALGSGQSAQGGYNPTSSSQSFRMPDLSQQANANPEFSGWSSSGYVPNMEPQYGQSASQTSTGIGDMSGIVKMPMNPGLQQSGLTPGAFGSGAFNNMFGGQQPDQNGYDFSNGGQLSF